MNPRQKWRRELPNLQVGDVVFLVEADTVRGKWPIGRIQKVYPGPDGLIRTVDVLIKGKVYRRPIVKLCKLPLD